MLGATGMLRKSSDLLLSIIPEHTKRMVFLVSFSARLKSDESEALDKDTLAKINRVMVLCKDHKAMELPNLLSRAIWRGKTAYDICRLDMRLVMKEHTEPAIDESLVHRIAKQVKLAVPKWLDYESLENDAVKLLKHLTPEIGAV